MYLRRIKLNENIENEMEIGLRASYWGLGGNILERQRKELRSNRVCIYWGYRWE